MFYWTENRVVPTAGLNAVMQKNVVIPTGIRNPDSPCL